MHQSDAASSAAVLAVERDRAQPQRALAGGLQLGGALVVQPRPQLRVDRPVGGELRRVGAQALPGDMGPGGGRQLLAGRPGSGGGDRRLGREGPPYGVAVQRGGQGRLRLGGLAQDHRDRQQVRRDAPQQHAEELLVGGVGRVQVVHHQGARAVAVQGQQLAQEAGEAVGDPQGAHPGVEAGALLGDRQRGQGLLGGGHHPVQLR
jgi:hypothetical protein